MDFDQLARTPASACQPVPRGTKHGQRRHASRALAAFLSAVLVSACGDEGEPAESEVDGGVERDGDGDGDGDGDAELSCGDAPVEPVPYPGSDPTTCALEGSAEEYECDGIIYRTGLSGYSRLVQGWDAESLELVGYRYCSDNTTEFGECGQCKRWGTIIERDDDCATRDPCAKFAAPPTSHTPYCGFIETAEEGWYWGDTGELIERVSCHGYAAVCEDVNKPKEGWRLPRHGDRELVLPDPGCHRTIGIAIGDEPCGLFEGAARCNAAYEAVYCNAAVDSSGMPIDGETGVCMENGSCEQDADCRIGSNYWMPRCSGASDGARCMDGGCVDVNCSR